MSRIPIVHELVGHRQKPTRKYRMETVYLPGDRDATMLAELFYRDARLTWEERRAKIIASDCASRSFYYGNWPCTFKVPCVYCREINN